VPIDPANDPNEAYDVGHMPAQPHGLPADWWTIFCNGVPVYHFAPDNKAGADRYASDPAYRLSLVTRFLHASRPRT
jgi:hypothetical protein